MHTKIRHNALTTGLPNKTSPLRVEGQLHQFIGHGLRITWLNNLACLPMNNKISITTHCSRNDWQTTRHGFQNGVANALAEGWHGKGV